jgi:hypothetical protein
MKRAIAGNFAVQFFVFKAQRDSCRFNGLMRKSESAATSATMFEASFRVPIRVANKKINPLRDQLHGLNRHRQWLNDVIYNNGLTGRVGLVS